MILFRLLDWICRTLSLSHLIVFSYFIFPNKFPKCVSEQVHFLLTCTTYSLHRGRLVGNIFSGLTLAAAKL